MSFKPSYVWPNPAFPFRVYFKNSSCRVFIIENIKHNWEWLSVYKNKIRPTDYFFVYCGWYYSKEFAVEDNKIFEILGLNRKNFYFMFNSEREKANYEPYELTGEVINHNAWLDENLVMMPLSRKKKFDAIYVARRSAFKRHYLASKIESLALIAGINHGNNISQVPKFKYLNKEPLPPEEVCEKINESYCGLILSELEGACFSSSEYLLCGIPVVSTPSFGGRDVWYDSYNSIICEPNEDAVLEAVTSMVNNPKDPIKIRTAHITHSKMYRSRFIKKLKEIFDICDVRGVDPETYFIENFFHKMRVSYAPDFEGIFGGKFEAIFKSSQVNSEVDLQHTGDLFVELATKSFKKGEKIKAADYWIKAVKCFKQVFSNLLDWRQKVVEQGPTRAGSLYRELAIEAKNNNDKASAAGFWIRAVESLKQTEVILPDWQKDTFANGYGRAGSLYLELASEAMKKDEKELAAGYWIRSAECFKQLKKSLPNWQQKVIETAPGRSGSLYCELALQALKLGNKQNAANHWVNAANSYNQSPSLTERQRESIQRGLERAGDCFLELAKDASKNADKYSAAKYWIKSVYCFKQLPAPRTDLQQEILDRGPIKAGNLYYEMTSSSLDNGDYESAANHWTKAAGCFKFSQLSLDDWQKEVLELGASKASDLYAKLALLSFKNNDNEAGADYMFKAIDCYNKKDDEFWCMI